MWRSAGRRPRKDAQRLLEQALRTDDPVALDSAIAALDAVLRADPGGWRLTVMSQLSVALYRRYKLAGRPADLDRVVDLDQQLADGTPQAGGHRARYLNDLGHALSLRFEHAGRPDDLHRLVAAYADSVARTPPGDPDRPGRLDDLHLALITRFELAEDPADLRSAVRAGEEALDATPAGDPGRVVRQSNLGAVLLRSHRAADRKEDLDRAAALLEEAVDATPAGHPSRAGRVFNLAGVLTAQARSTGSLADLDRAAAALDEVLATAPDDHPKRTETVADLSTVLDARFLRTGRDTDLDRAVTLAERTLAGGPMEPAHLNKLGASLAVRYHRGGDLADLDRAINVLEQAAGAADADHPGRAEVLSNLGNAVLARFRRTGNRALLNRAIDLGEEAVDALDADAGPNRAILLSNLGGAIHVRYYRTGDRSDLERALTLYAEAAAVAGADDADRAMYLANLGDALADRYRHTGERADLDRATSVLEEGVATVPADHPEHARWAYKLGSALAESDPGRAALSFQEAALSTAADPALRADAARRWGAEDDPDRAVEAFTLAVRLAGAVAPRTLRQGDQEHRLASLAGLGREAAAACLAAGRADRAVELFEQGRAVLFTRELDLRTDLTDLARDHSELAERFVRLVREAEQPAADRDPTAFGITAEPVLQARAEADRRRTAAVDLNDVLAEIRGRPGFAGFLLPLPLADLLPAASAGPVVLVNVAEARSDALILRPTGVEVLPLPGVTPAVVTERVNAFLAAVREAQQSGDRGAEDRAAAVLGWLWDEVTGPVLDYLGLTAPTTGDEPWPRVFWCPSGPLGFLPFHAAGHHETRFDATPATVIDRVVSSTVPTVRVLLRPVRPPAAHDRVLVVAVPVTPGEADLRGAVAEAELLAGLLPEHVDVLGPPGAPPATFASVVDALPGHAWAHFSCHGTIRPDDPSAGRLLLPDHEVRPLTVLDLSRARLDHASLAFLSACSTARSGSRLPDEPIHLAAACLLAGYRHVIATLWPIDGTDAVGVSRTVYAKVAAGGVPARADLAAVALHQAGRRLRTLYPRLPSRWAAHIHAGP